MFYLVNGVFEGSLAGESWIFAIANMNDYGVIFQNGNDLFSPKTTSTVVPEPSTLLLLGAGLVGLGLLGRRKFRTKPWIRFRVKLFWKYLSAHWLLTDERFFLHLCYLVNLAKKRQKYNKLIFLPLFRQSEIKYFYLLNFFLTDF